MPAFFLELFSEEIPARMQPHAAEDLSRLIAEALAGLSPTNIQTWYGPRRIALAAEVSGQVAAVSATERGPRANAPEQALQGFLRKHAATRDQLRQEGDYWVLEKQAAAVAAPMLIAAALPGVLRRFPWPKSMRWGGTSHFTWVRPLRRIVCLLDGEVVPFDLRDGTDDGHSLVSGNLTEGHRFHAPGAFAVSGAADWTAKLRQRHVLVDVAERKRVIAEGVARIAKERSITIVDDPGLLDEIAGLVEWPVPLAGRIADEHMDLPPEIRQVSMRVNQRYFAARSPNGDAAPWFVFAANIEAADGGAAIIAGNERVLRARFADARHFWDLDRKARLDSRVPSLDHVTFHAKLGTQGQRVKRLRRLAEMIAPRVNAGEALADRAAELAKADLVTGMVAEFPELQGVIGRYYALHDHEDAYVADAIRDHYAPRGPADPVPAAPVSIAVALADKLDQLACFFAIDERPTGAGDPYALRRAALGVIRIIRENGLRLKLLPLLDSAVIGARQAAGEHAAGLSDDQVVRVLNAHPGAVALVGANAARRVTRPVPGTELHVDLLAFDILEFLAERLRVQLRTEGARHDVLTAVFAAGSDDDITRLLRRTEAVSTLLGQDDGANLLAAYRRAANILRIEERKDGPHTDAPDSSLLAEPAEANLHRGIISGLAIGTLVHDEKYAEAMAEMAKLRGPLDAFFESVTVNAAEPQIRRNRLRLLNQVRTTMDRVADFSRIEG
ncbi:MAG TPA: glycine--tRNA ligase subunit beta [Acetobacteraceae bacterium]|nr:glycine--tRNA ligase subunit beta [Acetobacteraceae bacterium]